MERDINGYPDGSVGCMPDADATLGNKPLAYAYVPIQAFNKLYSPEVALTRGTLFEELDKPMEVYGNE